MHEAKKEKISPTRLQRMLAMRLEKHVRYCWQQALATTEIHALLTLLQAHV